MNIKDYKDGVAEDMDRIYGDKINTMTYDINNLGKFENKFPHKIAGVIDDFGSTVKTEIKDFILQDRQEAYNAGLQSGLEEVEGELFNVFHENYDAGYDYHAENIREDITKIINKLKQ